MVATLQPGVIVKGRFGPLAPYTATSDGNTTSNITASTEGNNEDVGSRQRRQRCLIEGQILYSVGPHLWMVHFEDDEDRQCHSRQLQFVFDPDYVPDDPIDATTVHNEIATESEPFDDQFIHTNLDNSTDSDSTEEEESIMDDVEDDVEEDLEGNLDEASDDGGGYEAVFDGDYTVYEANRRVAEAEKAELIRTGYEIVKTDSKKKKSITWKAVESSVPTELRLEFGKLGVREMDWDTFLQSKRSIRAGKKRKADVLSSPSLSNSNIKVSPFFDLFLLLWPGSWQLQLKQLNELIEKENSNKRKNGKNPKRFNDVTQNEFFVFLGIIISAGPSGKGGRHLFQSGEDLCKAGQHSLLPMINFARYMKQSRFNDIRSKFHFAFFDLQKSDPSMPSFDPWYPVVKLVEEFNQNRMAMIAASHIKVQDESMSAWKPRKDKTGGLPNISFIKRKPEPLGTEFKSVACGKTGIMLQLEIQRGQKEMPIRSKYFREYGATSSCALRAVHDTSNCGQREVVHQPNIFYGDSWFASVKTADNISEIGHEFVGPVKTSTTLFVMKEFESLMKSWPGGTHLVLEGTSPNNNGLLAVGYKYNKKKVLSFVATKNAGSTLAGEPYRARFVGDNNNVCSRRVERPEIISSYFKHSNVIDKHNHARQYELRLEKHWVTLNCWFRIVTTIIGMCVVDCWKAYRQKFGDKEFTVCKFAEQLAFELMNNTIEDSMLSLEVLSPIDRSAPRRSPRKSVTVEKETSEVSPLTDMISGACSDQKIKNDWLWMETMQLHPHEKNSAIDNNGYARRIRCKECGRKTPWLCTHCKIFICKDTQGKECNNCYRKHVMAKHPSLKLQVQN